MTGDDQRFADALRREGVEAACIEPLAAYLSLLSRWNTTHNLVAAGSLEELVRRHVVEALAGAGHLPSAAGLLIDVGSGAGLPGIPLLVARPGWRGILVEPRTKRWAFLHLVVRELGLDAEVVDRRYQEMDLGEQLLDVVVSRALGGHDELLAWSREHLRPAGKVLLWTTEEEVRRLESAPGWRVVSSPLPELDRGRLADFQPCFT